MKSKLQSAVSWMSKKLKGENVPEETASVQNEAENPAVNAGSSKAEDSSKIVAFVSTVQTQSAVNETAVTQKVRRVEAAAVEEAPRRVLSMADLTSGPEIKVVVRGAKHYGVCPHCEATWNIRERLTHPSFKRAENTKGLTCPSCDKSVGLPPQTDLRKLS